MQMLQEGQLPPGKRMGIPRHGIGEGKGGVISSDSAQFAEAVK
jgi:hypothetical protein